MTIMTKEDFIKDSIKDIQETIRAVDRKLFGTIVILLLPLTQSSNISTAIKSLYMFNVYIAVFFCSIIILFGFLAFITSCLGIYSVGNPAKHISRKKHFEDDENIEVTGSYYNGSFFKVGFWESYYTKSIESIQTLENHVDSMSKAECNIYNELVFEQCKVTYIRELKMKRQKISLQYIMITVITIGIVFVLDSIIKLG